MLADLRAPGPGCGGDGDLPGTSGAGQGPGAGGPGAQVSA